jgi:hypothetical protein
MLGGWLLLEAKIRKRLGGFTLEASFSVDNEILAMLDGWKKRFAGRKLARSVDLIREDRRR